MRLLSRLQPARCVLGPLFSMALLICTAPAAQAVPAFSRQTGQECAACHVGGYGPQLTPAGIRFKLGGYIDSDGKEGKVPLSAMAIGSFTHTSKDQDSPPNEHAKVNNNLTFDEASVFLAGKLANSLGAFVQATYDGNERKASIDQLDLRMTTTLELGGKPAVAGISVNNNPGVQDPFNSSPVWSFPYTSSGVAFEPGAATLLNGGLEQRALGLSAYLFWNDSVYGELGTYRTLSPAMQSHLGLGRDEDPGILGNGTAYWRLAYFKDIKRHAFSVGTFGMTAGLQPDRSGGPSNRYRDIGVDAMYQYLGNREHVATLNASYIRENQMRNASVATGGADNLTGKLNEFKVAASYHYKQTWGVTTSRFDVRGDSDATLYGNGYANGSPNTSGYVTQLDWTPWGKEGSWMEPWANLRVGMQYTYYTMFNGASTNYDGNGRNAKDNNTVRVFGWTSF